ncbi:hypothetical protein DI487_10305 [Flavobacterium sediminis]|uniref:Uncharacterized protein n=1 Tax=Flavobacterium sediminis TaxID=2201181 RepID=A0A2U8QWD1_9FLAO|nr:hypothetical protein [Flavobacterium sediminis]AWM14204.1 hypothetical protein DI487_10305 [Flavobacterium sediminis]
MVTIINYKERQTEEGKSFFVLEVQGGIEMVQSQTTGKFYATARKAFVPSTFDEMTCKALIGTQMAGAIVKEECDAYEYVDQGTGEMVVLTHRYAYAQEQAATVQKPVYENFTPSIEAFSKNGKHHFEPVN